MALTKGAIFLAITVGPLMAHGAEITIPLTVGFELIGQQLAEQVYTEDGNAPLWRESDCRYLSLDSPAFSHQDGRLRFTTHGAGSFGAEVLETCVGLFGWKAPANQGELVKTAIDTAALRDIKVQANGVVVPVVLRVPDAWVQPLPTPSVPQAPLTPTELEAFQDAMERWDAFLVFVIKGFGQDLVDPPIREQLFDLLMTSRHDLIPVLTGAITRDQGDPVRRAFVER
ncbi:MAG: hypothetical protein ACREV3_04430 [Gammaproteobacteria bacterium]